MAQNVFDMHFFLTFYLLIPEKSKTTFNMSPGLFAKSAKAFAASSNG